MGSSDGTQMVQRIRKGPRLRVIPGKPPGRPGGPGGQPPFVPTDEQREKVMRLVAAGFTVESISIIVGVPHATLERHFKHELVHGKTIMDGKILGGIVNMAVEGDKTMMIFYARARGGWKHAGEGSDPNAAALFQISIGNGPSSSDSATEIKVSAIPRTIDHDEDEPT